MAIKGKKKKSGGKAKAVAPKRPIVVKKPKLLARRGVQATGASALALILGLVLGWAFWHGPQGIRPLTKQESARIATAQGAIEGALARVGQPAPPANFVAFPDTATSLDDFSRGKMSAKAFGKLVLQAAAAAKAASAQIAGVDMTTIANGLPVQTADQLLVAQDDLKQALRVYEASSLMLYRSTAASGKERASLISEATTLRSIADELMSKGYRFYLLVLNAAGLRPTSAGVPPGISGLPQGQSGQPPVVPSP